MNMTSITIQDIPTEALFPYLLKCFSTTIKWYRTGPTKSPYCSEKYKNYLVLLSRCRRVCKEWNDYFSDPAFWKPVFRCVTINHFYDKKLNLLYREKKKKLKSSDWSYKEKNDNRCLMIVENNTKIPFDIYYCRTPSHPRPLQPDGALWCSHKGLLGNMSLRTCPNERFACIPTKEWLQGNPYSTLGFSWIIDVFNLEEYRREDGTTDLAYVVRIKEPDYSKMHQIKDLNKEFLNYPKKLLPLLFDKQKIENDWEQEKATRKKAIKEKQELEDKLREIKKEISESQERSNNYLFLMNQMD